MDGVEAVACDMNSDYHEAFEEMCPHIQPVLDYFHIVKNFNDKVISLFQKEEVTRKPRYVAKYKELLSQNELLFTLEII